MEGGFYTSWKDDDSFEWMENVDEEKELNLMTTMPSVPQIRTPKEPMEFLSRSWSLSASEITKALSLKQKQFPVDRNPNSIPEAGVAAQPTTRVMKSISTRRLGSFGKWFNNKEFSNSAVRKKDRMRVENARMHSAVSIAGLAAALAAVTSAQKCKGSGSKMDLALASATELLASHCLELAESSVADHDRVDSVIRSAIDVTTPGDLLTLTAAAATALRGEAALRARFPKEPKKTASISPCDRGVSERHYSPAFHSPRHEQNPPMVGELLQLTRKGVLQWKHISVYVNKKSQVIVKLKSKHVGGALSKKNKCIVYGICDETAAWPYRKERDSSEEVYFGLKTAQGLMEFKCKNKIHKQRWVEGIRNLFGQVGCVEATGHTLDFLNISNSI